MSDLIIAIYGVPQAAFRAGESLAALQRDAGTEPEDIVVVTKDAGGRIALNQSTDLATGQPLAGGRWGALIGMLFLDPPGPRVPARGLAAQLCATGIDPAFLHEVGHALDAGGGAVGLRVRMLGTYRVQTKLQVLEGNPRILHTRLGAETEEALIDLQDQIPHATLGQNRPHGSA